MLNCKVLRNYYSVSDIMRYRQRARLLLAFKSILEVISPFNQIRI